MHLSCMCVSGLLTCLVTHPLWLMKTRRVIQSPSDAGAYRNAIGNTKSARDRLAATLTRNCHAMHSHARHSDGLAQIWKQEGFLGWYRGFIPALLGVSHGAIQFMAYEELKVMAAQYRATHPHQLVPLH